MGGGALSKYHYKVWLSDNQMRWTQAFVFVLMFKNIHAACHKRRFSSTLDTNVYNWDLSEGEDLDCNDAYWKIYNTQWNSISCSSSCAGTGGSSALNLQWGDRCCKSCPSPYRPINAWSCQATCGELSSSITCSNSKKLDSNTVCNEGSCDEATCCVPATKCSEVTCDAGFNRLDDSTVCPAEGCTPAQCCATTCDDYWSRILSPPFGIPVGDFVCFPPVPKFNNTKECFEDVNGEPGSCVHGTSTFSGTSTCCGPLTKCSEVTCDTNFYQLDDSTACPVGGCTSAQCCRPTCAADDVCQELVDRGLVEKSNLASIACSETPCQPEECCDPTCYTFENSGYECSSNTQLKAAPFFITLTAGGDGVSEGHATTLNDCCEFTGNCADIKNQFNQLKSTYDNNCPCA